MSGHDIPMDKAELLSVILEGILYGFSLLMFGGTIWLLVFRRSSSSDRVNAKMLAAACALLVLSTMHLVVHIIRVMEGLIISGSSFPGGVNEFFADTSQWTFVWGNYIYTAQSLVGDAVVLDRCYTIWRSKLVMILPFILWCGTFVTGFTAVHTASLGSSKGGVFVGTLSKWIASFWAMALSTNLLTTALLAWRIWYLDHKAIKLRGHQKSPLRPLLRTILDAGLIYSLSLVTALVCFLTKTNAQYVTLDMISPIISITFYMVIVRVRVLQWPISNATENSFPLVGRPSSCVRVASVRHAGMQVQVTTMTESKTDRNSLQLSRYPLTPISDDCDSRSDNKVNDIPSLAL